MSSAVILTNLKSISTGSEPLKQYYTDDSSSQIFSNLFSLMKLIFISMELLEPSKLPNLITQTSSLAVADYRKFLPPNVRSTINKLNISNSEILQLKLVISRIENILKKQNIKYNLSMDTFIDPEYPEWMELKIIIKINNFKSSYKGIKSKVYDILNEDISETLYQKLIIKIQPF